MICRTKRHYNVTYINLSTASVNISSPRSLRRVDNSQLSVFYVRKSHFESRQSPKKSLTRQADSASVGKITYQLDKVYLPTVPTYAKSGFMLIGCQSWIFPVVLAVLSMVADGWGGLGVRQKARGGPRGWHWRRWGHEIRCWMIHPRWHCHFAWKSNKKIC